jgi:hypothetical protein
LFVVEYDEVMASLMLLIVMVDRLEIEIQKVKISKVMDEDMCEVDNQLVNENN